MLSSALYKGNTLAIFNSAGNNPLVRERFKIWTSGSLIAGKHDRRILRFNSSWPGAEFFKFWNILVTSSKETGSRNIVCTFFPLGKTKVKHLASDFFCKVRPDWYKKLIEFFTYHVFIISDSAITQFKFRLWLIGLIFIDNSFQYNPSFYSYSLYWLPANWHNIVFLRSTLSFSESFDMFYMELHCMKFGFLHSFCIAYFFFTNSIFEPIR